jgi:hypothetical protein
VCYVESEWFLSHGEDSLYTIMDSCPEDSLYAMDSCPEDRLYTMDRVVLILRGQLSLSSETLYNGQSPQRGQSL